jgi:hypothetical protein
MLSFPRKTRTFETDINSLIKNQSNIEKLNTRLKETINKNYGVDHIHRACDYKYQTPIQAHLMLVCNESMPK